MMNFITKLKKQKEILAIFEEDFNLINNIEESIKCISTALNKNLPVLIAGNGGSASDALHITGELVGRFLIERKALNVLCLNSNVSVLTAWSNDYSYETCFSRQIEAHGLKGGVFWGISTSGNSKNIVNALKIARKMDVNTISLTGKDGGECKNYSDYLLNIPSKNTPEIQELHILVYHYMCEKIEIETC